MYEKNRSSTERVARIFRNSQSSLTSPRSCLSLFSLQLALTISGLGGQFFLRVAGVLPRANKRLLPGVLEPDCASSVCCMKLLILLVPCAVAF